MIENNPYVGPRALQEKDRIYGRKAETYRLLSTLIANRIVLLHSPSGAGKSSLVNAGLIPLLREEGFTVLGPVRVNLEPPPDLLQDPACNRYVWSVLQELEEHLPEENRSDPADLVCKDIEQYLNEYRAKNPSARRLVLILDQFEEILTVDPLDPNKTKKEFFNMLGDVLFDNSIWALFSAREDYIAALDPYLSYIPTRLQHTFRLDFLGLNAAREAIQGPLDAKNLGISFTKAAVDKLIEDLASVQVQLPNGEFVLQDGQYVEPVQLQVVCRHLFNHLDPGTKEITVDKIEGVTDVNASLSLYYEEQVNALAEKTGIPVRRIRDFFSDELITKQEIRGLVQRGASVNLEDDVIRMLVNAHLVRSEKRLNSDWYELAHDRMITPVLQNNKAWVENNLNLLQSQARVWASQSRSTSLLLRGEELARWQQWAKENQADVKAIEREFLDKSEEREILRKERLEREQLEQQREQREKQREIENAQRLAEAEKRRAEDQTRSAKQLRVAFLIAIVLFVAAIGFYLQSLSKEQEARTSRIAAEQNEITAIAAKGEAEQQRISADNLRKTAEVLKQDALTQAGIAQQQVTLVYIEKVKADDERVRAEEARAAAETAQDEAILAREEADKLRIEAEKQLKARSQGLAHAARSIMKSQYTLSLLLAVEAFTTADTPQARSILMEGLQYKFARGYQQTAFVRSDFTESPLAFSPDGQYLAWGHPLGHVVVFDTANQKTEKEFKNVHSSNVRSIAVCSAGEQVLLASGGRDLSLYFWSLSSDLPQRIDYMPSRINALSFSPDCKTLAASSGTLLRFYAIAPDGNSAEVIENLQTRPENHIINAIAWSQDGKYLASGNLGGQIYIFDIARAEKNYFKAVSREVTGLSWQAKDELLAMDMGGVIRSWNIDTGEMQAPFPIRTSSLTGEMAVSPDKSLIAVGGESDKLDIFNAGTGQKVATAPSGFAGTLVQRMAFGFQDKSLLLANTTKFSLQINEIFVHETLSEAIDHTLELSAVTPYENMLLGASFSERNLEIFDLSSEGKIIYTPAPSERSINSYTSIDFLDNGRGIVAGDTAGNVYVNLNIHDPAEKLTIIGTLNAPVIAVAGRSQVQGESLFLLPGNGPGYAYLAAVACEQRSPQQACIRFAVQWYDRDLSPGDKLVFDAIGAGVKLAVSPGEVLPGGDFLAASSPLGKWDLTTNDPVFNNIPEFENTADLQFISPDTLAVATTDKEIYFVILDADNAAFYGPLQGLMGTVIDMAVSLDGKNLYTLLSDNHLLRWPVNVNDWIVRVCQVAGRNMTEKEWNEYFPGQTQHATCPGLPSPAP
jgi:WD40 repeat protein